MSPNELSKLELSEKEINNVLRLTKWLLKGGRVHIDRRIYQAFPTTNESGPKVTQIVKSDNEKERVLGLDMTFGELFNLAQAVTEEDAVGNSFSSMKVGEIRGRR